MYFSIKSVAKREGVTVQAVLKWIKTGKLHAEKQGGRWYIPQESYWRFNADRKKWKHSE